MFALLLEDPRISKTQIARKLNVNPNTAYLWFNEAIEKKIIIPPIFRRKAFTNFKEYFYFLNVKHPHLLYEELQKSTDISYFCVQTGFANFQIISKVPLDPKGKIVLEGTRSDYHVTIPPECTFGQSIQQIRKKLDNLTSYENKPSPLTSYRKKYEPWDEKDEEIYWSVCDEVRRPIREIIRDLDTYADKVIGWFRKRDEFGHTIITYFPDGESSYLPSLFSIKTEYDALLIDLFSCLPVSNVFYRLDDRLILWINIPFFPSPEARILPFKILSILKKEELVDDYTNSVVQYHYRT
jgi:hypothetical protein